MALSVIMAVAVAAVAVGAYVAGVHRINEGNVGVYWYGGALQNKLEDAGYHWAPPVVSRHAQVSLKFQTAVVENVACGTRGGVVVSIERVEMVYRLKRQHVLSTIRQYGTNYARTWLHDTAPAHIGEMCSKTELSEIYISLFDKIDEALVSSLGAVLKEWVPGVEIISIRLTKPVLPDSIQEHYLRVNEIKSQFPVMLQQQRTMVKRLETERKKAIIDMKKRLRVANITASRLLADAEARVQIGAVEDSMLLSSEKEKSDSFYYSTIKEAESNTRKLTDRYLALMESTRLLENTDLIIGDSIPGVIVDEPNSLQLPASPAQ